jgi:hypothetical protein
VQAARFQFRTDGGSAGRLLFPADDAGWMRIAIELAATSNAWDIQLNLPYYQVCANQSYLVRFQARADHPRSLSFGVAEAHSPWSSVGCHRNIPLTSEWQIFESQFIATRDDENARIHFDLGESDVAVELTAPSLRRLPGGEIVGPTLELIRLDQSLQL